MLDSITTAKYRYERSSQLRACCISVIIAHLNGDIRKTDKSSLLHKLELDVSNEETTFTDKCHSNTSFIIDLMATVHSVSTKEVSIFSELSVALLSYINSAFKLADVVAVVPDRYDILHSIKCFERSQHNKFQYVERIVTEPQIKNTNIF